MPTTQQLRSRLIKKLKELFQLDQPDLDFGFYRVMHAKAEQVETFLDKDLLKIVTDAFGQMDDSRKAELKAAYEQAIETAKEFGAADPQETPAAKKAKAALDAAKDTVNAEGDIYDHLYRFFERYYDNGDFLSKRYYTRETSAKAAPFAVPYNGEEVKLHWANADQYYIKTAEYFTNYSFDLATGAKLQLETIKKNPKQIEMDFDKYSDMPETLKVHFKIIDASEGEHGNVKASEATKRFFIIHKANPVELDGNGELVINFEYRPDPEKGGKQEGTWRQHRNNEATAEILKAVEKLENAEEYPRLLSVPAPTDKEKDRPLLAKYINQYTARNTMDYFIHKDLGSFLSRELDFYIKNEVMRLDDIENADVPAVESYLAKIKVLRKIAGKLIDFLAQLEDFQKKLWLKKKFVTETNYCITLDRIPEELYEEIAANDAQREEWVKLFAIDEIQTGEGDLLESGAVAYSNPLTVEFLKDNPYLVLDTKFFGDGFKEVLISSITYFDENIAGVLINSDNYHAIRLIEKSYTKQINSIYLDPPYNADASEIIYKNGYKHSSWLSLILSRFNETRGLMAQNSKLCITIDDYELQGLLYVLDEAFGQENHLGTVPIRNNPQGRSTVKGFSINHEYAIFYTSPYDSVGVCRLDHSDKQIQRYSETDDDEFKYLWENFRKTGTDSHRPDRLKQYYPLYIKDSNIRLPKMNWNDTKKTWDVLEKPSENESILWPNDDSGTQRVWKWGADRAFKNLDMLKVEIDEDGSIQAFRMNYLNVKGSLPNTWWDKPKYAAGSHGTNLLTAFFGTGHQFQFPKSVYAVEDCLRVCGANPNSIVLDYFAGSGTTAHAVINLNRTDEGARKYVMVEAGNHFDDILMPRVKKCLYSVLWKDGKPQKASKYIQILKKNISNFQKELKELKGVHNKEEYDFKVQKIKGEIENCKLQITQAENQLGENNGYYGVSQCFRYIRLESYEDTLNNLVFADNTARDKVIAENASLREDYMLGYMLDTETRGSQSLLNIDSFADPCSYKLTVKKPGTDEYDVCNVDLLETFNYLIGLRVEHIAAPQTFNAKFKREPDPELPEDQNTRLILDGKLKQNEKGQWWFRKVEGWVPSDSNNPNNGQKEKVLIVWRKLTGNLEEDNLMLDEWFQKNRISTRDFEFDTIYVNGSNNLPNLMLEGDNWKVRLIEEDFMKHMWDVDN